jgi:hypothetical protein
MMAPGHYSTRTTATKAEESDRVSDIAEILATGLSRLAARKSSRKSMEFGESSLHFTPDQSGDAPSCSAEASHD